MNDFIKALDFTIKAGLIFSGVVVGLLCLRILFGVVGVMLSSAFGTLILGYIVYRAAIKYYKSNK